MRLRRPLSLRRLSRRELDFGMINNSNEVSIRESRIPFKCNLGQVDYTAANEGLPLATFFEHAIRESRIALWVAPSSSRTSNIRAELNLTSPPFLARRSLN